MRRVIALVATTLLAACTAGSDEMGSLESEVTLHPSAALATVNLHVPATIDANIDFYFGGQKLARSGSTQVAVAATGPTCLTMRRSSNNAVNSDCSYELRAGNTLNIDLGSAKGSETISLSPQVTVSV